MLRGALHGDGESTEGLFPSQVEQDQIRNEYQATLAIPSVKRRPQIFLCPVGLIGAGKTTVMKPLSECLGAVRISTDEIRKRLKERGFNYVATRDIAVAAVMKYLEAGYSVTFDADCAGEAAGRTVKEAEKRFGVKTVWLHINPPEKFILNKLMSFKHTWLFRDGAHAVENYMQRKPLHEKLNMPFFYTFDTSKENLPQQIDEAIERIEKLKA